ncbi:DedA family protein [Oceaniglobus roseus]|uniref:DedA family protein n=1 Tax=Oceaniglobus roseus TaxID=1737570 RepID=UPI000C7E9C58|nr:VTT domain-containing protein [Kandeliimicrobium roseum]
MTIDTLVSDYGLAAIFFGCFLEGETVAITGGVMAHKHLLVHWQVTAVAACAAELADSTVFLLARRYRDLSFVRRTLARPTAQRLIARVDRRPAPYAFATRFIPGLRIAGPMMLAQSRLGTPAYLAIALCAATLWSAIFTSLGVVVGGLLRLLGAPHRAEHILVGAAAILVLVLLWHWHAWRRRRGAS